MMLETEFVSLGKKVYFFLFPFSSQLNQSLFGYPSMLWRVDCRTRKKTKLRKSKWALWPAHSLLSNYFSFRKMVGKRKDE